MENYFINFTPVSALIGGILVGIAATLLMLFNGRIASVSGITGGVLSPKRGNIAWRVSFLAGMIALPLMYGIFGHSDISIYFPSRGIPLVIGGVLVGFGSQMGNGCVSGHGVCGVARLSARSIMATIIFVVVATLTVFISKYFSLYSL